MSNMVIGSHVLKKTKIVLEKSLVIFQSQSNPSYSIRQMPSGYSNKLEFPIAPDYNVTESMIQTKFHILKHIEKTF